jgi:hypothetical protein
MTKKIETTGDCYEVAGRFCLNNVQEINEHKFQGKPYLVHAEVTGQGEIEGIRFGHAWIEDDYFIYDFSNGLQLIYPKVLYYSIGKVIEEKPKYFRYEFQDANRKMAQSGNFGPWDLITESGL